MRLFWEMHRHRGHAVLEEINRWLLGIFDAAARSAPPSPSSVHEARFFRELFSLPADKREQIAQALHHDFGLYLFPGTGAAFSYPQLSREEKKQVNAIYQYVYTALFSRRGVPLHHTGPRYDRRQFARDFTADNPQLDSCCPVCLHHKSDLAQECDVEHFLPKRAYPAFALHPDNLYLACKECNQLYKKTKTIPLSESFLPYRDTVRDAAEVVVTREDGRDKITLLPKDPAQPSVQEKLTGFVKQFDLDTRWTKDCESFFRKMAARYRSRHLDKAALLREMREDWRKNAAVWELPEAYVEGIYWNWVSSRQFDAFYAEMHDAADL